jgi:hypothetical protein
MRDMNYYNSFWYRFTLPIKRLWFRFLLSQDKLIKVDERHRGIGKTYMMIEKAIKHDIPIIAGNQRQIDTIKRTANVVEIYGFAKNFTKTVEGMRFPNGILIDESVDPELIPKLKARFEIRGGFIQNYRSDKK